MEEQILIQIGSLRAQNKEPRGIIIHKKDAKEWVEFIQLRYFISPESLVGRGMTYRGIPVIRTKDIKRGTVIVY